MRTYHVARVLLVALAVVSLLGSVGCVKKLTESEYEDAAVQMVEDLSDAMAGMEDALPEEFYELEYDEPIGDENVDAINGAMDDLYAKVQDIRDEFGKINPPDEYADAHEDFLAGLDGIVEWVGSYRDMFAEIDPEDTQEDLEGVFEDSAQDADEALEDAGGKFEDAAEEVGITEELEDAGIY